MPQTRYLTPAQESQTWVTFVTGSLFLENEKVSDMLTMSISKKLSKMFLIEMIAVFKQNP